VPTSSKRRSTRPAASDALRVRALAESIQAVYVPGDDGGRLLLWTDAARAPPAADAERALELLGTSPAAGTLSPGRHVLLLPTGSGRHTRLAERAVRGHELSVLATASLAALAAGPESTRAPGVRGVRPSASLHAWCLAAKLALELVAREQIVPVLRHDPEGVDGTAQARWAAVLTRADDRQRLEQLAGALPPAAHARPAPGRPGTVWQPASLLRAFLDAFADAAMREAAALAQPPLPPARPTSRSRQRPPFAGDGWERRFVAALSGPSDRASFAPRGFEERHLPRELEERVRPILATDAEAGGARACFRLELPDPGDDAWRLELLLQAADEPGIIAGAADVWRTRARSVRMLGRSVREPQERLLRALAEAARIFPPLAPALRQARPTHVQLDGTQAWSFLSEAAPLLDEAGFGVLLPEALTARGERRLRARLRVGGQEPRRRPNDGAGVGLDALVGFRWEAAIGDETLTEAEFLRIAKHKQPLVRWRGRWLVVDPRELERLERRFRLATGEMTGVEAMAAALSGVVRLADGVEAEVVADGHVAGLVSALRDGASAPVPVNAPAGFHGELRPYQARGVGWLAALGRLGLGGVLADDMGLGKTIQLIALLLHERAPGDDVAPTLIVCPTSVFGNWEHELGRFAPSLRIVRHHGTGRERRPRAFTRAVRRADVVLTTYGTARRDGELLEKMRWRRIALDEAQNIKNPDSQQARIARSLPAAQKVALSGTPVENRLDELWSILDFTNAGLLGPRDAFQRRVAAPIERYGDADAAARLRRLAAPFILRRTKTDPAIAAELPDKQEMRVWCTLTSEQAALYQVTVDEALAAIEALDGITRRGRVLALLTALKQVCNHPAHYLDEPGPLAGRSGKLARLGEMLEEVAASGERALVFTQYREMGDRLVAHLEDVLREPVPFLHGGVPRGRRDELVHRFQHDERAPTVFVLSLRAGGVGLNLTRASHVFHYDRWWNPAVEDQATDRAFRIGQRRNVQVHKFVTIGTLEERIDELLERKRALASAVVGSGEGWITELSNGELRALVALGSGAAIGEED
jgi:hypothetical protein